MPGAGSKDANETVHPVNRAERAASRQDAAGHADDLSTHPAGTGEDPDLELVRLTDSPDEAMAFILKGVSNYGLVWEPTVGGSRAKRFARGLKPTGDASKPSNYPG